MNNDPISEMDDHQVYLACFEALNMRYSSVAGDLTGFIIEKLQEWKVQFEYDPKYLKWIIYPQTMGSRAGYDQNLQVAFLQTAQALGHWSPPKKVEKEEPVYWLHQPSGRLAQFSPDIESNLKMGGDWKRVTVTPYKEEK